MTPGDKKKIGIITILKVYNYGTELQAYALQEILNRMGYDAEIIDYLFYKHPDYYYTPQAKPFVRLGFQRRIKEYFNPLYERLRSVPYWKAKRIRNSKFGLFHQQHTRLSPLTFRSINELYRANFDYDVFMVGSDQVWNPYTNVSLKPYFLTFAPHDKQKVSYASSFGISAIPPRAHDIYREFLNNLDHISVREEQGIKIVKELTGRNVQHVMDPTFLLGIQDWQIIADCPEYHEPYILLYELVKSPFLTRLAKKMAGELGWILVRICKNAIKEDSDSTIMNIIDAGPSEFLGLFLNASFVLTNSFHGTAFSINFGKPFYTILPKHKLNNSRQQGLLTFLKLSDRLIKEGEFPEKKYYFPDLTDASRLLIAQNDLSLHYLSTAVDGTTHQ